MTEIPATFRAYVAERLDDRVERGPREFSAKDLPPGEVDVRVAWSSVNYKDGLATRFDGKVARISPLIPGIDLAGEIIASRDPALPEGTMVVAHGYELGVARHGGFSEYQRVPAGWVVPLHGMTPREAMTIGTAGFTAAMSVAALEERGLDPADGPVLVTGASGGVGGTAVAILAERGYEVWALTGKPDEHGWLMSLGASGFLTRDEAPTAGPPLEREGWPAPVGPAGHGPPAPGPRRAGDGADAGDARRRARRDPCGGGARPLGRAGGGQVETAGVSVRDNAGHRTAGC